MYLRTQSKKIIYLRIKIMGNFQNQRVIDSINLSLEKVWKINAHEYLLAAIEINVKSIIANDPI